MLFITQLIYLQPDKEIIFDQFEKIAIPILEKYEGKMLLRLRPEPLNVIEGNMEIPYEIHLISFGCEADYENFKADEERINFLHLKEQSIRNVLLIKGEKE